MCRQYTCVCLSVSSGDAGLDALVTTSPRVLNPVRRRQDFPPFRHDTPQSRPRFPLVFKQCLRRFRAQIFCAHRSHRRWGKQRRARSTRLRSASPITVSPSEVHAHEQVEIFLAGEDGIGSSIAHEGKLQAEKRQRRAVCLFHAQEAEKRPSVPRQSPRSRNKWQCA